MDKDRFFGGHPLAVVLRLLVLSIVVGVVMSALGIQPQNLVYHLRILATRIYSLGFGAMEGAFSYFLIGAVVVIPVWLIARLIGAFGRRDDRPRG